MAQNPPSISPGNFRRAQRTANAGAQCASQNYHPMGQLLFTFAVKSSCKNPTISCHHVLDPLVVGEVDHVLWNAKITVWGEVVRVPRQGDNTGMAL